MGINQRYDIVNLKWIFANNLRSFRFENGQKKYTQETMSERLGLKQKTYNSYENENDSKMPPIRKIIELCNKLDVGLDDMLTSTEVNAGPHFQSTETEGMSDYLTEAQTRSVKRAVSNILQLDESLEQIKPDGTTAISSRLFGDISLSKEEMQEVLKAAQRAADQILEQEIRKHIDQHLEKLKRNRDEQMDILLSNQMFIDYNAYRHKYDILMKPVNQCLDSQTGTVLRGKNKQFRRLMDALPFKSFREMLYFIYFVDADPFWRPLRQLDDWETSQDITIHDAVKFYEDIAKDLMADVMAATRRDWLHDRQHHKRIPYSGLVEYSFLEAVGVDLSVISQIMAVQPGRMDRFNTIVRAAFLSGIDVIPLERTVRFSESSGTPQINYKRSREYIYSRYPAPSEKRDPS